MAQAPKRRNQTAALSRLMLKVLPLQVQEMSRLAAKSKNDVRRSSRSESTSQAKRKRGRGGDQGQGNAQQSVDAPEVRRLRERDHKMIVLPLRIEAWTKTIPLILRLLVRLHEKRQMQMFIRDVYFLHAGLPSYKIEILMTMELGHTALVCSVNITMEYMTASEKDLEYASHATRKFIRHDQRIEFDATYDRTRTNCWAESHHVYHGIQW